MNKTCDQCKHLMGTDDWNLYCDIRKDLCYKETLACDLFEEVQEHKESEQWLIRQLNFLQNEDINHGPIRPKVWNKIKYFGNCLIKNYGYTLNDLKKKWHILFN